MRACRLANGILKLGYGFVLFVLWGLRLWGGESVSLSGNPAPGGDDMTSEIRVSYSMFSQGLWLRLRLWSVAAGE